MIDKLNVMILLISRLLNNHNLKCFAFYIKCLHKDHSKVSGFSYKWHKSY